MCICVCILQLTNINKIFVFQYVALRSIQKCELSVKVYFIIATDAQLHDITGFFVLHQTHYCLLNRWSRKKLAFLKWINVCFSENVINASHLNCLQCYKHVISRDAVEIECFTLNKPHNIGKLHFIVRKFYVHFRIMIFILHISKYVMQKMWLWIWNLETFEPNHLTDGVFHSERLLNSLSAWCSFPPFQTVSCNQAAIQCLKQFRIKIFSSHILANS